MLVSVVRAFLLNELHYMHSVVLTVSNVGDDAAAVRDEETKRLSRMTLQTQV